VLYVIGLVWPRNGEAVIHSLAPAVGSEPVQSITLLGGEAKVEFDHPADGLHVRLPGNPPAKYAYVLRLVFDHTSH